MKQVLLYTSMSWADVVDEAEEFYVAKDVDGVMVHVVKDGNELIRDKEE